LQNNDILLIGDKLFRISLNLARNEEEIELNIPKHIPKHPNALSCGICEENIADTTFQPCMHLLSCSKCAQKISICPKCQSLVKSYSTSKLPIFSPNTTAKI